MRRSRPRRRRGRAIHIATALASSMAAGLAVTCLVLVTTILVARRTARDEAVRDARNVTARLADAVVRPALGDALLDGDDTARRRLGAAVEQHVLGQDVVGAHVWAPDGRILYSDEPRLTGARYPLSPEARAALRTGRPAAAVTDLDDPEHRFDGHWKQL